LLSNTLRSSSLTPQCTQLKNSHLSTTVSSTWMMLCVLSVSRHHIFSLIRNIPTTVQWILVATESHQTVGRRHDHHNPTLPHPAPPKSPPQPYPTPDTMTTIAGLGDGARSLSGSLPRPSATLRRHSQPYPTPDVIDHHQNSNPFLLVP
jgi:hypothetical protein